MNPPCFIHGNRKAVRALVQYAFATDDFAYLTVGHFSNNPASARVIAKTGFERDGKEVRECAARGEKAYCLTYRLDREKALAELAKAQA